MSAQIPKHSEVLPHQFVIVYALGGRKQIGQGNSDLLELRYGTHENSEVIKQIMVDCGAGIKATKVFYQGPIFRDNVTKEPIIIPEKLIVLLTHGHLDHILGLLKLWSLRIDGVPTSQVALDIYGSPFTNALAMRNLRRIYFNNIWDSIARRKDYNKLTALIARKDKETIELLTLWEYILGEKLTATEEDLKDPETGEPLKNLVTGELLTLAEYIEDHFNSYNFNWVKDFMQRIKVFSGRCVWNWHNVEPNFNDEYTDIPDSPYFTAQPFSLSGYHTIHDPLGWWVEMAGKLFVFCGDIKHAPKSWEKQLPWGDRKINYLFLDSTGATNPGWSPPEHLFEDLMMEEKTVNGITKPRIDWADCNGGRRIIVFGFSTNTERWARFIVAAYRHGKTVGILGRSLEEMLKLYKGMCELVKDPHELEKIWHKDNVKFGRSDADIVISTGCQNEPGSGFWKFINGTRDSQNYNYNQNGRFNPHRLRKGDLLIFSARVLPRDDGQETLEQAIQWIAKNMPGVGICRDRRCEYTDENGKTQQGFAHNIDDWGPSGHAHREDLKQIIKFVNPDYVIPVHGGEDNRRALYNLAVALGFRAMTPGNGQYFYAD